MARGQAPFEPEALRAVLAASALDEPIADEHLADYRAFYGLEFAAGRHQVIPIRSEGETLALQLYAPATGNSHACVVLCHGYYDHVGLYGHVIGEYLARGITVITYDQIGHGLSTGERVVIEDFQRYIEATETARRFALEHLGLPDATRLHYFGQSMGGSIVMDYLHQHPERMVGEIVLFAPLIRPFAWGINRWVFELAKRFIASRPRTITNNAENAEFLTLQQADRLQAQVLPVSWVASMVTWIERFEAYPTSPLAPKIVQGQTDRTVSWQHNEKVLGRRYPNHAWLALPEAKHHLANESEELRDDIWRWLDAHCGW